jgi:hypothetical protein
MSPLGHGDTTRYPETRKENIMEVFILMSEHDHCNSCVDVYHSLEGAQRGLTQDAGERSPATWKQQGTDAWTPLAERGAEYHGQKAYNYWINRWQVK